MNSFRFIVFIRVLFLFINYVCFNVFFEILKINIIYFDNFNPFLQFHPLTTPDKPVFAEVITMNTLLQNFT